MTEPFKTSSTGVPEPFLTSRAREVLPVHSDFRIRVIATLMLATASLLCGHARAAGDAAAGKTVFANQCSSCHTTEVGKNGFGPSLAAVLGRKAGGLAGFTYSPAMAQAGLVWDDKTLDEFLTSSTKKVPAQQRARLPRAQHWQVRRPRRGRRRMSCCTRRRTK